jgi:hypothetical protein
MDFPRLSTFALLSILAFASGCTVTTTGPGAASAPPAASEDGGGHSITGATYLAGTTSELAGHWKSDSWGDMVFRFEAPNTMRGAYTHDDGTVLGTYSNGIFRGWWTEVTSRQPDADAGEVEFRFVRNADGTLTIDGRWCYGHTHEWHDDWDMNKSPDSAPAALVNRLDDKSAYPAR